MDILNYSINQLIDSLFTCKSWIEQVGFGEFCLRINLSTNLLWHSLVDHASNLVRANHFSVVSKSSICMPRIRCAYTWTIVQRLDKCSANSSIALDQRRMWACKFESNCRFASRNTWTSASVKSSLQSPRNMKQCNFPSSWFFRNTILFDWASRSPSLSIVLLMATCNWNAALSFMYSFERCPTMSRCRTCLIWYDKNERKIIRSTENYSIPLEKRFHLRTNNMFTLNSAMPFWRQYVWCIFRPLW